jgi:response regulator RpfG family c-di-GMP phosphodiesterase/tRNA A-37 threonylcarbamoyl transferase component Bud32
MVDARALDDATQPTRQIRKLPPIRAQADPQAFLDRLVAHQFLDASAAGTFVATRLAGLHDASDRGVGLALVQAGFLTPFQLENILANTTYGLIIGNYRLLDRIGSGGMGDVFLAEHRLMKRQVAVKTMPVDESCIPEVRQRFYAEMRALAELQHPNVVTAFDAGEMVSPCPEIPGVIYIVMEYLAGGHLGQRVAKTGALPVADACAFIRQAALGLQAAHDIHLVHRDLKPSNILLTLSGQVKLVDFGLVRQFSSQLTDPRVLLGSVDCMAPEQSLDPSAVGKPADLYSLGATLFWLLTGQPPYPPAGSISGTLRQLQHDRPRRVRDLRPDVPVGLDDLVDRLLQRDPALRPPRPIAVARALESFIDVGPVATIGPSAARSEGSPPLSVLIVDDERSVREFNRKLVESINCVCAEAGDGAEALARMASGRFDLVLLDRNLPDCDGYELCRSLRDRSDDPNLKIVVVTGAGTSDDLAEALARGADDFVAKPHQARQLLAKVQHAFRHKEAQERAALLAGQLQEVNAQLQQSLVARDDDVREAHRALLSAMARMGESRDGETPGHLYRLREYALVLAAAAARRSPEWAGLVDERFREHLRLCVPLHDIGKIGLPDDVLRKPAALTDAERRIVEQHPVIGDRMLESLAREHGSSLEFLGAARAIVRSHHERWDGKGYPDRRAGDAIPASARLTAVADVYDALRRRRQHKPALAHDAAVGILLYQSAGQFDPSLLRALETCHGELERIYREIGE